MVIDLRYIVDAVIGFNTGILGGKFYSWYTRRRIKKNPPHFAYPARIMSAEEWLQTLREEKKPR